MARPQPALPSAEAQLSSAMVVAHGRAKAHPGEWQKRPAHYQRVLAWKYEAGSGRHTVVLQGAYLTPDVTDREMFEACMPPKLRLAGVKEVPEKKQMWFLLESEPPADPPLQVPPGTPRLDRAGDHLPPIAR